MYFPPAFFDVMVHLCVHIVDDIIDLGPSFLHNMMPFERMNGIIKGFVRNMFCPAGSIVQGYLTQECISFCENFLYGADQPPGVGVGLPVNKHELWRFVPERPLYILKKGYKSIFILNQTAKCTGVLMFTMRPNINMVLFADYQKLAIYGYCQ